MTPGTQKASGNPFSMEVKVHSQPESGKDGAKLSLG